MNRTPPAAHAAHDEMLIARLFGGDVSDVERAHALELMGECGDCAALFADLADIASATEALPIPARPRDFSLSAADAARLKRRRWGRSSFAGVGLRRSLGGSMAALGVVGLMLAATTSLFGGSGGLGYDIGTVTTAQRAAPNAAGNGAVDLSGSDAAATMAVAVPGASSGPQSAAGSPGTGYAAATAAPISSDKAAIVPEGPAATMGSEVGLVPGPVSGTGTGSSAGNDSGQGSQGSQNSQGSVDARLVWLAGFGLLFAVGLAIILIPWLGRRRRIRS